MSYLSDTKSVCPYAQSYPRLEVSRYLKLSLFWLLRVRRSGQSLFGSVLNHLDNFDYLLKSEFCMNNELNFYEKWKKAHRIPHLAPARRLARSPFARSERLSFESWYVYLFKF